MSDLLYIYYFLKKIISENSPDWEYGATLIHDDVFTDYAEATARSTCSGEFGSWPLNTIDWTHAAEVLQDDYMQVEYNGETYWVRA